MRGADRCRGDIGLSADRAADRRDIVATLQEPLRRKVTGERDVDSDLIGGVSIRIGDEVIDASVRGKLAQLAATLKN